QSFFIITILIINNNKFRLKIKIMYKKLFFFLVLPVLGISQTQIGLDIDGKTSGDRSGTSVSLSADGNIVAIGAPDTICTTCPSGTSTGYVSIYENISGIWVQIGGDIYGIKNNEAFGHSVSLSADGSIVAVSAFQQGVAGSVRVRSEERRVGTGVRWRWSTA